MICPHCGSHISDDVLRCPACHGDLGMTTRLPRLEQRWCANCGALVPLGADRCSTCGTPVPVNLHLQSNISTANKEILKKAEEERKAREEKSLEEGETHAMPRIESAVPANPEAYDPLNKHDNFPRARVALVAALASLLVVGGTVLYITHPWNAEAFATKAKVPADTSMAGFPGKKNALSQDKASGSDAEKTVLSADELTYQKLMAVYKQYKSYEEELEKSETLLKEKGTMGSADERKAGHDSQEEFAIRLDNTIKSLDEIDITTGTYAQDVSNFKTLGSWLRNWSDDLRKCWKKSAELDNAEGRDDEVFAAINEHTDSSGKNTFRSHFDSNYSAWKPTKPAQ